MKERAGCKEGGLSSQLRPEWTGVNVAIMVFFFVTGLWFLGLAMIGYMIWGRSMGLDFSRLGQGRHCAGGFRDFSPRSSGNSAFDEWREAELRRLDEERRRLDEERAEFADYMKELRRAKDRDEFEAYRRARRSQQSDDDIVEGHASERPSPA
ncbi:DUF2852 domain-containing protein [Parvularcula bermudensis]|uniref:DUF2852 domain-containing protein n=1 Tax=Parvularcula bermudensis TaxID=208216 RepID=UPI0002DA2244|nr:DUF2852 domain-containing protein [Parvularcula bermudensis]